jgi:L-iditol 2-dehydrogenase
MVQAVLKELGKIELVDVVEKSLKHGEARIKVISCAICGSDIRILNHGNSRIKLPHVIGHEVVGEIIEVSDNCDLKIGDICCFGADLPCDDPDCEYCNNGRFSSCDKNYAVGYQFDGGFAETMIITEQCWKRGAFKIIPHQNKIEDYYKYSLIEPLACAVHGVTKLNVCSEDRVFIFGGGPIGLMIGDVCKNVYKCKSVTILEINESRRELISTHFPEFNFISDISEVIEEYDVIFTANSVPVCHKYAIDIAAKEARINLFGGLGIKQLCEVDTNKIHYKELIVTGTHGSGKKDFELAFSMVEDKCINLDRYITSIYKLTDINKAFEAAQSLRNLKIIIKNQ